MIGRGEHVFAWLMIGVIAVAAISTFGPSIVVETDEAPTNWLYHYQGLVGGVLTIAGAFLGGFYLNRQMGQTERLERERTGKDREAERAVLPLTLSAICDYAATSGRLGKSLLDQCVDDRLPRNVKIPAESVPRLPSTVIADLKELVRSLEPNQTAGIAKLISEIQVHEARMRSFPSRVRHLNVVDLREHILDAAQIYARSEAFFDWARRDVDHVPVGATWGRVTAALFIMGILRGMVPELDERILRVSGGNPNAPLRSLRSSDAAG